MSTLDAVCAVCGHPAHRPAELDGADYSYLLRMYLGDGYLARFPRTWCLRIILDSRYPAVIAECVHAVKAVVPHNAVGVLRVRRLTA